MGKSRSIMEEVLCRNCNEPIVPVERYTEAGLDYCKKYECLKECGERIAGVAVVMVHKQGFNVIRISEASGVNYMDHKNSLG